MKRSTWGVFVCLLSAMAVILPACNNAGGVAVSFVQATTQAIDNGQTFNITAKVNNDSSSKGVTWSLTGPGSLTNMTTTSVTYNAPAIGAVARFAAQQDPPLAAMVTAKSNADPSKSATVTITVTPPPSMSNQTLATGTEGTAYSQPVVATGGAGTLSWTIIAQPGPQPAGLNINSGTGVISGTPTGPNGTFAFTVKVTDSNAGAGGPQSAQAQVTIMINLPPAPKISPVGGALAVGTEGTPYNQPALTVSGGLANFTWTVVGGDTNLPAGLHSAQSGTGNNTFTISGTPTGPNKTTNFQIKVTDSSNPTQSDTQSYSITINLPPPPKISPTGGALPAGTIGTTYTQVFTVNNGLGPTFTWTPPAPGTLPTGLTPTISPGGATLTISGTPTGPAGPSNFTLKVTDSSNPQQSDLQNYSLQIKNPPPPTITTTQAQVTAAPATVGTAYNFTFQGSGTGTLTWSATGLPADGLSLNASSGAVTGTPASKQTLNITVTLSDTFGQSSPATPFTITVNNPAPPVITTTQAQIPSATVGVSYSLQFTGNGFAPLTWSATGLPADNLAMSPTGLVTGTPTTAQTVNFTVTLTDGVGQSQSGAPTPFSITVSATGISFTQAPPAQVTAGSSAVNVTATVTNDPGNGGVDWSFGASCGGTCGSFGSAHTPSGAQNTWTPPTTVPAGGSVTIIAASHDFPTVTVSATVTINAPAIIIVFNQSPPTSLAVNGTANVSANVSNDPSNGGVDWTVTCGSAGACGSFNPTHTVSGNSGVTVYTAPAAVPSGSIVTIKAASHTNSTQFVTANVTITSGGAPTCPLPMGGNEALLNGTYAALFNGFSDGKGMFQAAASFTATGSSGTTNISSVVADTNGVGQTPQNLSGTGCYSVGSDRRGTMIWNFTGQQGVVFAIAVRSNGNGGRVIEFDDSAPNAASGKTRGSGQIKKQTAAAFAASTLNGNLAVGVRGSDSSRNRNGVGAVLTADGVSMITSGTADIEFASTTGSATFVPNATVTGMFTAPDATHGRGAVTLNVTLPPPIGVLTLHFAYYVIDTTQMFVQSTDTPDTVGHALQNGLMGRQSGGPFSIASLNGSAIFSLTGVDPSSNHVFTDAAIGYVTSSGNGSFTGVLDQNVNAVMTHNGDAISGTVSIGSNGLGTLTITSPAGIPPFTIVMVAPNTALMLGGASGSPNNNVPTGILQAQTGGGSFTGTSVSGTLIFGSDEPTIGHVTDDVGAITAAFPNLTITQDSSSPNGLQSGQMQMATYTMTMNGRGIITLSAPNTGTAVIWLLQTNKAVILPQGQTNSAIFIVDQ